MEDWVRQKVIEIVRKFGADSCRDTNTCRAIIKDYCHNYKREQSVLLAVISHNLYVPAGMDTIIDLPQL